MKLDTQKQGLSTLMKPYKAALLKQLYAMTSTHSYDGMSSGYLWEWLYNNAGRINALNEMVDQGVLKFVEVSGKGGMQRRYSVAMTTGEFEAFVKGEFIGKLVSVFEGEWWKLESEE